MLYLSPRLKRLLLNNGIDIPVDTLLESGKYILDGVTYLLVSCQEHVANITSDTIVILISDEVSTKNIKCKYLLLPSGYHGDNHIFDNVEKNSIINRDCTQSCNIHTVDGSVCMY